jgi:hypothetical protein
MDGDGAVLGLGLTGCLRLGAVLAFLDGWDGAWDLPLLRVSTIVKVGWFVDESLGLWTKMNIRVRFRVEMKNMMKLGCLLVIMEVDDDCLVIRR